jgi:hypothetical protein
MELKKNGSKKHVVSLLSAIIIFFGLLIFTFAVKPQLLFLAHSKKATVGQLSWIASNQQFSDQNVVRFSLKEQLYQTVRVDLPRNIAAVDSFHFTAGNEAENAIVICYMLIKKGGFKPIVVPLHELKPVQGIRVKSVSNVLNFNTTSNHPVLAIKNHAVDFNFDWILLLFNLFVSIFVWVVVFFSWNLVRDFSLRFSSGVVTIGLVVVFVVSLLMALGAKFNASPDERDHFMTADYYKTHSTTPLRNAESGAYTYNSLWNYSRVYLKVVDYFIAGKISNLFDKWFDSYISVRFFGLFLIVLFIFLVVRFPRSGVVLLPFLFTPQTWYLFSYVNDASLPLFLSFCLLLLTESIKPRLIDEDFNFKKVIGIVFIGLLLGLLLLSKKNYMVFTLFYLFYIFTLPIKISGKIAADFRDFVHSFKRFVKVPLAVVGIALCVFAARELTVDRQKVPLAIQTATYYNQSKVNFEKHIATGISGEARFKSYPKMMKEWVLNSFKSFFGTYGFMRYWGTKFYYKAIFVLLLLLILGILTTIYLRKDWELAFWSLLFLASFVVIVFASSYLYSYRYDYQAQGKYLVPVLPILGLIFLKAEQRMGSKYFNRFMMPLFIALILLSLHSFVFVGYTSLCL